MAVLEGNDQLGQLWALIQELSEQLSQNRSISVSLHGQTGNIKNQAVHSQTGFVLRRFNLDKTKGTFRNRAQDVQERELSLIRDYETKLLARQEEFVAQDLATSNAVSESLVRISHHLRQFLRSLGGEDADSPTTRTDDEDNREPWTSVAASDHALEREIELARLEKENEELKRMMGLLSAQPRSNSEPPYTRFESPRLEQQRIPSIPKTGITGAGQSVGPFGTYKRMRPPG
ncbi:hypothetical protein DXG03_003311 [Asterophora parasitica]|uniref:Uncharacterized protein n=1 Tax=Asterophora parasitica TaxID=117018 RepID=A0A9P7KEL8_9AGAR|nr:hypothetical protein DXG03_003311 [Asterophora parasitica]